MTYVCSVGGMIDRVVEDFASFPLIEIESFAEDFFGISETTRKENLVRKFLRTILYLVRMMMNAIHFHFDQNLSRLMLHLYYSSMKKTFENYHHSDWEDEFRSMGKIHDWICVSVVHHLEEILVWILPSYVENELQERYWDLLNLFEEI